MANLSRINVAWQNWPGAPGVSTFYYDDTVLIQPGLDALRAFFNAFVTYLPSGMTIQVPGSGDRIDDASGNLLGVWSATQPAVVTGTAAGAYAGNAGAVIHWLTSGFVNGRRLRGRTFLVPLVPGIANENNGSLATAFLTAGNNAATTMLAAVGANLRVWHRPVGGAGGSSASVTAHRIPDLAVSLRSRRV
jgi:hypothetical protein